jgi:hypothetical protein
MVATLGSPLTQTTCAHVARIYKAAGALPRVIESARVMTRAGGALPCPMTAERGARARARCPSLPDAPEGRPCWPSP